MKIENLYQGYRNYIKLSESDSLLGPLKKKGTKFVIIYLFSIFGKCIKIINFTLYGHENEKSERRNISFLSGPESCNFLISQALQVKYSCTLLQCLTMKI